MAKKNKKLNTDLDNGLIETAPVEDFTVEPDIDDNEIHSLPEEEAGDQVGYNMGEIISEEIDNDAEEWKKQAQLVTSKPEDEDDEFIEEEEFISDLDAKDEFQEDEDWDSDNPGGGYDD